MAGPALAVFIMHRARCIAFLMCSAAMSATPILIASAPVAWLFVAFGGVPVKNAQVGSGGASHHRTRSGLTKLAQAGCRFVHISASRDQLEAPAGTVEWIPIRPNTDTAVMLALAHELLITGKYDEEFLRSHCTGFERWRDYLLGADDGIAKTVDWAATISEVPAARLRKLASGSGPPSAWRRCSAKSACPEAASASVMVLPICWEALTNDCRVRCCRRG